MQQKKKTVSSRKVRIESKMFAHFEAYLLKYGQIILTDSKLCTGIINYDAANRGDILNCKLYYFFAHNNILLE